MKKGEKQRGGGIRSRGDRGGMSVQPGLVNEPKKNPKF